MNGPLDGVAVRVGGGRAGSGHASRRRRSIGRGLPGPGRWPPAPSPPCRWGSSPSMGKSASAMMRIPKSRWPRRRSRSLGPSSGRWVARASRTAEARQTKIPAFQTNRPVSRNPSAVARSGFSRKRTTPVQGDPLGTADLLAALDVAVAGLGAIGGDPERDEGRWVRLDHRRGGPDRGQERIDRLDDVVGGHHDHRFRRGRRPRPGRPPRRRRRRCRAGRVRRRSDRGATPGASSRVASA